jgi:hypothetical protein
MFFIAHAAWAPGRKQSLATLLAQIPGSHVVTSTVKEHANVWWPRLLRTSLDFLKPKEWGIYLNDDVTIASAYSIMAMLERADAPVSLATVQPEALKTEARWLRSYCCTGPGYALRREDVVELLEFHAKTLTAGMREKMNEDEVIAHWAWSKQQPLLQCVPALVKHDVAVKSTLGYDGHPMRVASRLWTESDGLQNWPSPEGAEYCTHPWLGEGRMQAVRRAYLNGWSFDDICVFCATRPILIQSPTTGAGICGQCLADGCGHILTNARVA